MSEPEKKTKKTAERDTGTKSPGFPKRPAITWSLRRSQRKTTGDEEGKIDVSFQVESSEPDEKMQNILGRFIHAGELE